VAIRLVLTSAASSLVLLFAGSASAAHTVFPPGSPFTGGTDVITDFPTCFGGTIGPVGLLNDGAHFFADDFCTHTNDPTQNSTTYRFPVSGGSALSPQASAPNGLTHGITVDGGVYYGIADGGDSFLSAGLYRLDPSSLAVTGPIATIPSTSNPPLGLTRDPLTGDLYVSSNSGIFRVQNPSGTPIVTTFVSGGFYDGIAFTSDGSRLYAARPGDQHVLGFDRSGNVVLDVNDSPHGPDGIAVAEANRFVGSIDVSNNVFVNANDGTIERIDVNNGNALTVAAAGGSRGDFATVGPDDCLYVTQSSTIEKLSPCFFQPTTPAPATLRLAPATATNVVGTQHCVTATVKDASGTATAGIAVVFSVPTATATHASPASGSSTTDSNGQAVFCFTASLPGQDAIHAFADTNRNGTQDTGEPFGDATKTWTLPPSTAFCTVTITNGGWIIANNGDHANFGGNAKADGGGTASGQENYQDQGPVQPMDVHSLDVTAVTCSANHEYATIFGDATIGGFGAYVFRIDVRDGDAFATSDAYGIMLSNGYDSGVHALQGGNVTIH
jgi:hypothetical protein